MGAGVSVSTINTARRRDIKEWLGKGLHIAKDGLTGCVPTLGGSLVFSHNVLRASNGEVALERSVRATIGGKTACAKSCFSSWESLEREAINKAGGL